MESEAEVKLLDQSSDSTDKRNLLARNWKRLLEMHADLKLNVTSQWTSDIKTSPVSTRDEVNTPSGEASAKGGEDEGEGGRREIRSTENGSGISCFLVHLRHLHPFLNFFIGMSSACFIRILRGGVKSGIENESGYKLSGKPVSVTAQRFKTGPDTATQRVPRRTTRGKSKTCRGEQFSRYFVA